jgi:transglutaminase-like putative cysteine protease
MRFESAHRTTYRYDAPVYLEPHLFRLCPRTDGVQRLERFELSIDPPPAGLAQLLDPEGNLITQAWFIEPATYLKVESRFAAETLRVNPYDFLLPPAAQLTVPLTYPEDLRSLLDLYRVTDTPPEVTEFARKMGGAGGDLMTYLESATRRIFEEFRHTERLEGPPLSAFETLAAREGSCRDLAVLFAEVCRAQGIAARFVSGYERASAGEERSYMHAWTEVYVPGGGWRGYDPSRGLAVSTGHIAVAASLSPSLAAPISGGYRGSAKASMEVKIVVSFEDR